ncbi:MAG TPA: FAD-dependent oxidoreductase [Verrucomicrobiae bacterium]|nr:FAD-dependent oxidoreductase [Verrucomicrobiae bacterium]
MNRRKFLKTSALTVLAPHFLHAAEGPPAARASDSETVDVLVYGSTPSGVAAAVEAARRGCKVLLACPQKHAGGMAASGLSTTDTGGRRDLYGGFMVEFVQRVHREYRRILGDNSPDLELARGGWVYEPSVAEKVFTDFINEQSDRLSFYRGHHLLEAKTQNGRVTEISLVSPRNAMVRVKARTFIDATYEGDLAAAAKVKYRVGREGRDEYGESKAGIHYMNWRTGEQILTPDTGEPSPAIQAFCARSIFTDDPAQLVSIEKPATYEQHLPDYLPLMSDFQARRITGWEPGHLLPRRKYQMNGRIDWQTSINCPGVSWTWPEAQRFHRERLAQFHVDHVAGLIWFLQNHPGVPEKISKRMRGIGLHKAEFADTGHWPWQIYVRQGRRIEGRDIVTQHNFTADPKTGKTPRVQQPIALGTYAFDIHPCHDRRFAVNNFMEGVLWYHRRLERPNQPGQIPYAAMLPKHLDNLLVPVALSATHIGMSVVRMEPVWITTGQISGFAAAEAKEKRMDVAHLDASDFAKRLKIPVEA